MNLIDKLKLFFTNKEIISRLFFTLVIIFFFRLLSKVPAPGIDTDALKSFFGGENTPTLFNLANVLAGGTLSNFSIVSIGLFSFISASLIMQLLSPIVPKVNELKKMGEVGTQILDQWTRILTVFIAGIQSFMLYLALKSADNFVGRPLVEDLSTLRVINLILVMVAGTMLLVWLTELCSEYGLGGKRGGGSSIIITAGILASLPPSLIQAFSNFTSSDYLRNFWITFGIEWTLFLIVILLIFILVRIFIFLKKRINISLVNVILRYFSLIFLLFLPLILFFTLRHNNETLERIRYLFTSNFARLDNLETRFAFYLGVVIQIVFLIVFLNESVRKISIRFINKFNYSKRILSDKVSYLPIKLLSVGVVPVLFSTALLSFPEFIYRFFGESIKNWDGVVNVFNWFSFNLLSKDNVIFVSNTLEYAALGWLNQYNSYYYHILHFIFTILFSLFFIFIIMEPDSVSNALKRSKCYIVGIRPGQETVNFISYTLLRVAFWSGVILGLVSIIPFLLGLYSTNIPLGIESLLFGGTSILILVSTFLSIKSQITAILINKNYDQFKNI